jgi:hypothetical protein
MKLFASSKNYYSAALIWIIAIGLLIVVFIKKPDAQEPSIYIFYAIILPIVGSLIWILLDTKYILKENKIFYNSGPFRGTIAIDSIKKIEHHSGIIVPVTFKPALNTKGLIIHYNSFDDIYISPNQENLFLEELLKVNPDIEIR